MNTHLTINKLLVIIIFYTLSFTNWYCTSNKEQPQNEEQTIHNTKEIYTCPMHPSVKSDRPGVCPVCNMSLVKVTEQVQSKTTSEEVTPEAVTLSPSQQAIANVSTYTAERMTLHKEIRAVGTVDYVEPNYKLITMRFPGRLEEMYINCCTGQKVSVGDPIADVYSPEAISAQQEFILALNASEEVQQGSVDLSDAATLVKQAKNKLQRWGFTDEQISELEESKTVKELVTIYSPVEGTVIKNEYRAQYYASAGEVIAELVDLSKVWMYADVYENEIQFLKTEQIVEATSDAYPQEIFRGKIIYIAPTVDVSSRTVRVRVEFPNEDERLKLKMFVNATIQIEIADEIVIPSSAIISTGNRRVVWVQKSNNVFVPRDVRIGVKENDYVQILDGISAGEIVVTSGGYLLDSEGQLQMGMGTSEHEQHTEPDKKNNLKEQSHQH